MRLGYSAITWGGVVGSPAGVTSVADLFYFTDGDLEQALTDISHAGYSGVEVFDGDLLEYADRPQVLLDHLSAVGLELVSVYAGANFIYPDILGDEMHKLSRSAELAARFGARHLVLGGGAKRAGGPHADDLAALAAGLDAATEIAAARGLSTSYHPHAGTLVERPEELKALMELTRIDFCPDTAHLALGSGDPAELIEHFGDRLAHVHLKDLDVATGTFQPLGKGDLDLPGIVRALVDARYDGWLVTELDTYAGHPRAAAEASKAYLNQLLKG
jgi:inosose dehydratase